MSSDVAWAPSILRATAGKSSGALELKLSDLRFHVRKRQAKVFVLFIVDSSDSMGARRRLGVAKAAVTALLQRAYQQRHEVAVVGFRGRGARLLLSPSSSVTLARRALHGLRPEGPTPLAAAVEQSMAILRTTAAVKSYDSRIVVILSDGEANVALHRRHEPLEELLAMMPRLGAMAESCLFIDTKRSLAGGGTEMQRLASAAGGRYYQPQELTAGTVIRAVRGAE